MHFHSTGRGCVCVEPLEARRLLAAEEPFTPTGVATAVAVQSDNRAVSGGTFRPEGESAYRFALVRYNSDGSFDRGFGGGDGYVTFNLPGASSSALSDIAIQRDGKIVAVGAAAFGGDERFAIARFNRDGSLDRTFNGTGFFTANFSGRDFASSVAIDPSTGKIVVAGVSAGFTGASNMAFVRLLASGRLDTTFDGDGRKTLDVSGNREDQALDVLVRGDGKVVAGGWHRTAAGHTDFAVVRLNTNGSNDTSWDDDGRKLADFDGGHDVAFDLAFGPGGTVVAAGSARMDPGQPGGDAAFALARFTSGGALDRTFSGDGRVATVDNESDSDDAWLGVAVQSDGRIVTAGFNGYGGGDGFGATARYLPNGSLDASFGGPGRRHFVAADEAFVPREPALQGSRIVYAGLTRLDPGSSTLYFAAQRLHSNGSLDGTFRTDGVKQDGTLLVRGTGGNDVIAIEHANEGESVRVTVNGVARDVPAADVTRVEVRALAGNDRVRVTTSLPAALFGGDGNDTLTGGVRADLLRGEGGDDVLFGRGGNDSLSGGDGRDALHGDDGDDFLFSLDGTRDFLSGGLGTDTADKDDQDEAVGVERFV